jgi:hypothetical protein
MASLAELSIRGVGTRTGRVLINLASQSNDSLLGQLKASNKHEFSNPQSNPKVS